MAITWTQRDGDASTVAGLTWALGLISDFGSLWSMGVIVITCDNADTDGAAHSTFTVEDTKGNTWTRRTNPLNDPGAALAGIEGAIFTTPLDGGLLTTGDTITITWDASVTAKSAMIYEASPSAGHRVAYVDSGQGTGTGTTPSITTGSITSGNLVVAACHTEYGTSNTFTADADTTDGEWSAQQVARAGTTTGGAGTAWQAKSVTATATQTYNPTLSASCDYALSWVQLTEEWIPVRGGVGRGVIAWGH